MPTQMQYYNSSPSMTGVLHPQTAACSREPMRAVDPFPKNTVPRIRPTTARTMSANLSGKRNKIGQMTFPQYNSLSDPHLFDFYTRKYGFQAACHSHSSVFLQMKGSKGKFNKQRLFKGSGSTKSGELSSFQFSRGSSHTFRLYGPEIGDIKNIVLEHDGLEKQQAWYVEEVSVTNTARDKTWSFPCQNWLSLFHNDCQLGRMLSPAGCKTLGGPGKNFPKTTGPFANTPSSKRSESGAKFAQIFRSDSKLFEFCGIWIPGAILYLEGE
ncbi:LOXH1 protein, partial [Polypterus senegalus]